MNVTPYLTQIQSLGQMTQTIRVSMPHFTKLSGNPDSPRFSKFSDICMGRFEVPNPKGD
jgi:hypothetical protein